MSIETKLTIMNEELVNRIKRRVFPDGHQMDSSHRWARQFKETILALKGIKPEYWERLIRENEWWERFGRSSGGVDKNGVPII